MSHQWFSVAFQLEIQLVWLDKMSPEGSSPTAPTAEAGWTTGNSLTHPAESYTGT